jgi:hypothetical protein
MSTYVHREAKPREQYATTGRKGVVSCLSPKERAVASDKLRAEGFTRLAYFETLSGFYCVEGLRGNEQPTPMPDDQAGE